MHAGLQNEYISVRNTIFYYLSDVLYVTPNRTCFFRVCCDFESSLECLNQKLHWGQVRYI